MRNGETKSKAPDEQAPATGADAPKRERRKGWFAGLGIVLRLSVAGVLLVILALMLSDRSVPLPDTLRSRIEAQVSDRLGEGLFQLGDFTFGLARDGAPRFSLRDVAMADRGGGASAVLNQVSATLSLTALLRGRIAARALDLDGAQITLKRRKDGRFSGAIGEGFSEETNEAITLPDLIDKFESVFQSHAVAALDRVEANSVTVTLEDARSGRVWQATNAQAVLRQEDGGASLSVTSDLFDGTDTLADVQLSLQRSGTSGLTSLGLTVGGISARDVALQTPALSFLSVLDAPLSGAVRAELAEDGSLASLAGTLDIEAGVLQPAEDVPPVDFDRARTYFAFDPEKQRIEFSDVSFSSDAATVEGTGYAYLAEVRDGWPGAFVGQFHVTAAEMSAAGAFPEPIVIDDLRADLRLRLDPFTMDFGQVVVVTDPAPVRARGRVSADGEGWHVSLDAETDEIGPDRVLAHWPEEVAQGTRNWLDANVLGGTLHDVAFGVRAETGGRPEISLTFGMEDGQVRVMRHLPTIDGAKGHGTLGGRRFTLVVDEGVMTPEGHEPIDANGSVFQVTDTRQKPNPARITLNAKGPIPAMLDVLDRRPFRIMERAGQETDIADGMARVAAEIVLPLKNGITPADVEYRVGGTLSDVQTEQIVPGKEIRAEQLSLDVTPEAVRIAGDATLDGVPISANWRKSFGGEESEPGSRVSGTVRLSDGNARRLGIELPQGMLGGEGEADYELALRADGPPRLSLSSDLSGVSLSLPALGWSLGTQTSAQFSLDAVLGETPEVPRLTLDAPGLSVSGALDLGPGGRFAGARFDRVVAGDWLRGDVALRARSAGQSPAVRLNGGRFDLRQFRAGSGGGEGGPIDVALDRVVVTDSIVLHDARGRLIPSRGGLSGEITARIDGRAAVTARFIPSGNGTAIRVRSEDAGAVLRDAALTPNARGGTLDLLLSPVEGAAGGTYDGQFLIEKVNLRKAPAMADLLDAISVVGLLDQLDGPGIRFDQVDGRFRLSPGRLRLISAAAVGGSMGISADGLFDLENKLMDVRGVVSPVYFLNGIGSLFTRRGEGLFGFNYRMAGAVDDPQVGVNPLSILTPGMFREIFRRPPPDG